MIYARYSSENQREESIEGQLRECKEYADYNDIEVAEKKKEIENIVSAIQRGVVSDTLIQRLNELKNRKKPLRNRR